MKRAVLVFLNDRLVARGRAEAIFTKVESPDPVREPVQGLLPLYLSDIEAKIGAFFLRHHSPNQVRIDVVVEVGRECKMNEQLLDVLHFLDQPLELFGLVSRLLASD